MKMDFSEALFLLKAGKRVRRAIWSSRFSFVELTGGEYSFFLLTFSDSSAEKLELHSTMILAEDWQEVEGEKK